SESEIRWHTGGWAICNTLTTKGTKSHEGNPDKGVKSVIAHGPKTRYNGGNPIAIGGGCEASASLWCYCSVVGGMVRCGLEYGCESVRSGSGDSYAHWSSARLVAATHRVQSRWARPAPGPDLPGTACSAAGDAAVAGSEVWRL